MPQYTIPESYRPLLPLREVEIAIKEVKDFFERELASVLQLQRVTAPFFVRSGLGLNDDLNGIEQPVRFHVRGASADVEVVQSLAKWKRHALKRYGFASGEGIYTDMNAIRPDETLDAIHSFYVDQWDWEKVIAPHQRNETYLAETVRAIYGAIVKTERYVASQHRAIKPTLPEAITIISSEELLRRYPNENAKERERIITKEHGAVFIVGIGGTLSDGTIHDGRSPDYDDWTTPRGDGGFGLNGDILVWNPVLEIAFELSSMGIRVSPQVLREQLSIRKCESRSEFAFHRSLLAGELPQTMGGGIGQSRLCMQMLRTAHIGEVACGLWPDDVVADCQRRGVVLL
ncbi:MAG: aspartate--ammonia ligase [Thermoguttaceae bacterium]